MKARSFNLIKIGGKQDDITIISAFIQQKKSDDFIENKDIFNSENKNKKNFKETKTNQDINYDLGIPIENNNFNSLREI